MEKKIHIDPNRFQNGKEKPKAWLSPPHLSESLWRFQASETEDALPLSWSLDLENQKIERNLDRSLPRLFPKSEDQKRNAELCLVSLTQSQRSLRKASVCSQEETPFPRPPSLNLIPLPHHIDSLSCAQSSFSLFLSLSADLGFCYILFVKAWRFWVLLQMEARAWDFEVWVETENISLLTKRIVLLTSERRNNDKNSCNVTNRDNQRIQTL